MKIHDEIVLLVMKIYNKVKNLWRQHVYRWTNFDCLYSSGTFEVSYMLNGQQSW